MFFAYFTEQPYAYPKDLDATTGTTVLTWPNSVIDPQLASDLYNRYLDEHMFAEEAGFDGIMLNEHHNTPFCMQGVTNIGASALARQLKKAKIVILGNVIPISDNPLRLAEETSMIDLYSRGRLVSGFVRGGGPESLSNNAPPHFNRERFEEGHDLIVKAWTTPGPFRWEGKHFQYRVVNPWAVPLQKPHPRVWIPGVSSRETLVWAAKHRYPYIGLSTPTETTKRMWSIYQDTAAEMGYRAGPEHRGYLLRCHVADTDQRAREGVEEHVWQMGQFTGRARPWYFGPPGYASRDAVQFRAGNTQAAASRTVEEQAKNFNLTYGNPKTVINRMKELLPQVEVSILNLWGNDGRISPERSTECIKLLGQEVIPAVREFGKELGYKDPFEMDAPYSQAHFEGKYGDRSLLAHPKGDYGTRFKPTPEMQTWGGVTPR